MEEEDGCSECVGGAEVSAEGRFASETVMRGNGDVCALSFDANDGEAEIMSGNGLGMGGKGRALDKVTFEPGTVGNGKPSVDAWNVPRGKPSPTPPGGFLVSEAFSILS